MTAAGRKRAAELLLAVLGHRPADENATAETWTLAAQLAREQRLGPHGHGALARRPEVRVPESVADEWRAAYRANGFTLLTQRRALHAALAVLKDAGIEAVALKGAALAWTVWPRPAERAMRDLDLLIAPADAPRAYRLLRSAGWHGPDPHGDFLEQMAEVETHLPPLVSPEGVCLELHGHVWRSPSAPGGTMPVSDSVGLMARARHDPRAGARVPAPADMLAHLVVHGAHAHLFNVGPLLLADVDYLTRAGGIDWPLYWQRAERDRYARASTLVLGLTERWRQPGLLARARCSATLPPAQLDQAEALLFQEPEARKEINLIAGLIAAPARAHLRLAAHPLDAAQGGEAAPLMRLTRRGAALARSLASGTTRADGRTAGALARWLAG